MASETSKNKKRRELLDAKFFQGRGIDIGCGSDPVTPDCLKWDKDQGDAQFMDGLTPESFDWVHSSHCLEHLDKPFLAIYKWWALVKVGGHLIVTVPDYALYEHKNFPSKYNTDHKWTFSMFWREPAHNLNIIDLVKDLPNALLLRAQLNCEHFDFENLTDDQTRGPAQAEIEIIVRKMKDGFWI